VIEKFQREQNVPTEKFETPQNAVSQKAQNVPIDPSQRQQNVPKEQGQNVVTPDTYRDNNTENKEVEKTIRANQETWNKTREQINSNLPFGETATGWPGQP
jgi:hypothetical protein